MAELIFYTNPQSRGRIVRWMLEEVGAPYETEILSYDDTMKGSRYLAINPMGKVPAIRHGEAVVTEAAAICAYLADAFPQAGLAPPLEDRAAYYRWLFFVSGPLEAAIMARAMQLEPPAERARMSGYGTVDRAIETLAGHLARTSFVAGERFTAADVYIGSHVMWGVQFDMLPAEPAFTDYVKRVSDREALARANAIDDALLAQMDG